MYRNEQATVRIYGPYTARNHWRVIRQTGQGPLAERKTIVFRTREEGAAYAAKARYEAAVLRMQAAIDRHLEYLQFVREIRRTSLKTARYRLEGILAPVLDLPLDQLTPDQAAELYAEYTEGRSADTHQGTLAAVRRMFEWARRKKLAPSNPWVDVEPIGRKNRGKPQPTRDQARVLYRYLERTCQADDRSLAPLLALNLGLRSSEIVGLTKADLDDSGTTLLVGNSHRTKTRAGRRPVKLPELIAAALAERARMRWGRLLPYKSGWVRDSTKRACSEAGIPPVGAHALRGLNATLLLESGVPADAVARALGHTSPKMTKSAYAAQGSGESFRVAAVSAQFDLTHKQQEQGVQCEHCKAAAAAMDRKAD